MAQKVRDVMAREPRTVSVTGTAHDAARTMKDADVGDVIVLEENGSLCGIVTDRDIAVRVVAEGRDPSGTAVRDITSEELVTISPGDDLQRAAQVMRERAVRRLPVTEEGSVVGVLSIGDLAIERDADSALADISAAPSNE